MRAFAIWGVAVAALIIPLVFAATSPLLAWRDPIYIAAGLAGVAGFALMLFQPLLAAGFLPGFGARIGRKAHRLIGTAIVVLVVLHVLALWVTSPPDVVDVMLLRAPAPFSIWGVVAMWAIFATALLVALRRPLRIAPNRWRRGHRVLAGITVVGSAVHALLIEGTMESVGKAALCFLILLATAVALRRKTLWAAQKD